MSTDQHDTASAPPLADPPDEITGLPGLRTWRRVYTLVFVVFIIYAVLLTIMSQVFA